MADIVRFKGYVYIEASRGLDGIKMAKQYSPDLILIDLILPDIRGYEVTTHLKSFENLKNTPIIALTADTQKNVKEMVLTAGCDGYISKPINVSEFLFKIEEFLAGKREVIKPDDEKEFLQKYNIQLVSRLKKKITELEELNTSLSSLNNELLSSQEELSNYNDRLFYLNNLANYLRRLRDPSALFEVLPAKMVENFQLKRCILFEINPNTNKLAPISARGISKSTIQKTNLSVSESLLEHITERSGVLWIKDNAEIVDQALLKFAGKLKSNSFLLANLSSLSTRKDSTGIFRKMSSDLKDDKNIPYSRRLLIFLDKDLTEHTFLTYEVRILKSFLQTVAVILENMLLYKRLMDSYKIKAQQAIHDGLTKIYNYRYFVQELERETNRTKRFHSPFSILMIDVDLFKNYNDKYGHLEGDQVLIKIAQILNDNTRTTDTAARYGGEEFAVLLPGLKKQESVLIGQKLRELVSAHSFDRKRKTGKINITISVGVASCPEDSMDMNIVLQMADRALYRAKERGRNQVCTA
jgi:diguanylate cyclase (GGDEF)-like protein